jgi:hypothetical protein
VVGEGDEGFDLADLYLFWYNVNLTRKFKELR